MLKRGAHPKKIVLSECEISAGRKERGENVVSAGKEPLWGEGCGMKGKLEVCLQKGTL